MRLSRLRLTAAVSFALLSSTALAEGAYRSFFISIPVVQAGGEGVIHAEVNLAGEAGLAIEASAIGEQEDLSKSEVEKTGDSLMTKGHAAALLISRYTDPARMAGFYWTLGAGYRQQKVDWKVTPAEDDKDIDYALVNEDDGKLYHAGTLKGVTGHGRLGYRYMGEEWPLLIGGYLGARHFQAGVDDRETDDERVAAMTDNEKDRLQRRFMTRPELGVEFGFAF